jgi:arabinofuranosyltransferase
MNTSSRSRTLMMILFGASLAAFVWLFVRTAWVVDDAYITFRTIDNFLSGHGLQWNVGERVQAYTHPLWMMAVGCAAFFTREYFYTTLTLSAALSVATLLTAFTALRGEAAWRPALFVLLFITSKAAVDFSSSGLENPLSYFLIVIFAAAYLRQSPGGSRSEREVTALFFVAALACVNRQDTLLLYLPMLGGLLIEQWTAMRWRLVRAIAIGWLPALLWFGFATFYYGFPLPNTAYAKMILDLPLGQRVARGSVYYLLGLRWDALAFAVIVGALVRGWQLRTWRSILALAGVVLYCGYVWVTGSVATHMAGRFFAVPFVLGLFVAVRLIVAPIAASVVAALALVYALINPVSPWKVGTPLYRTVTRSVSGYIDTAWFARREAAGLLRPGPRLVNECLEDGERFRAQPERVRLGGCGGGDPIGFFAFAAGPDKWIVDWLGLPDPLLARLRPCVDFRDPSWRPGHFRREIPAGYLESIQAGASRLADPDLQRYYGVLHTVVSGPMWSIERLHAIVQLNLGAYNRLLEPYNRDVAGRARTHQCRF